MNAASLVKPVIAQVALEVIDDLDEALLGDITVRHVLTHTTGLPNWRPAGEERVPLRPPGVRWGYSGEGFVLLMQHLEQRTGQSLDHLVDADVFAPLDMTESRLDDPEPGYHGYRPLLTTAADYGVFLADVLSRDSDRWDARWPIDQELAWAAGWGIELGASLHLAVGTQRCGEQLRHRMPVDRRGSRRADRRSEGPHVLPGCGRARAPRRSRFAPRGAQRDLAGARVLGDRSDRSASVSPSRAVAQLG